MVERKPENRSSSILGGWKPVDGEPGLFTTEKAPQSFMTDDFKKFSESMRARWSFSEYLKVKFQQMLRKKNSLELPPDAVIKTTVKPDPKSLRDIKKEISSVLPELDKEFFNKSVSEKKDTSKKK